MRHEALASRVHCLGCRVHWKPEVGGDPGDSNGQSEVGPCSSRPHRLFGTLSTIARFATLHTQPHIQIVSANTTHMSRERVNKHYTHSLISRESVSKYTSHAVYDVGLSSSREKKRARGKEKQGSTWDAHERGGSDCSERSQGD